MKFSLLAGLLVVTSVTCRSVSFIEPWERVEHLRRAPVGWRNVGAPAQDARLRFRIAVRAAEKDLLERTLYEVSSPRHPRYGQHLRRDEVKELVKPHAESTRAVLRWLEDSGIEKKDIRDEGDWISFHAPVKRAEEMMSTVFSTYQSSVQPHVKKIRSLSYSVPNDIRRHIDIIHPTVRFGNVRPQRRQSFTQGASSFAVAVNASCASAITPSCLMDLYNFANYKVDPDGPVTIGVNGFLEQYARFSDYNTFTGRYAPYAIGSSFDVVSVNGGLNDQNSTGNSIEANLDIQYTAGLVGTGLNTTFYTTPGRGPLVPDLTQPDEASNENEPYLELFTYLNNLADSELPSVISTSYGEAEQSVPAEYARKVCDLIAQLGTRGTSVIFSSGDTGPGSSCQTNDGRNATRFNSIFPAACPYVTSVGATYGIAPESAIFFSSGGFSDLWSRPKYQDKAVTDYLNVLGDRWEGLYNPAGRGFPDIAAQGSRFSVIDKGRLYPVGGTSASAPVIASIVALLNNARLGSGQSTLGFLNPWLYEDGFAGLTDIVDGGSTGCEGHDIYSGLPSPYVPYAGWNATIGWDPVTGYGTPDFQKLLAILNNQTTAQSPGYAD